MLKRMYRNRKLNNNGMTLVEVIITITVLALVSGAILSAFVAVMRMSTKSRDVHRATTVAQNIMEGINLKTAEELAYQFNYPVRYDSAGNLIDNFATYPSTMFQFSTKDSVGEIIEYTNPLTGDVSTQLATDKISLSAYNALTDDYDIAKAASAYMYDITVDKYDFIPDTNGKYIYYMRNIENDGRYYNAKITLDASPYTASGTKGLEANDVTLISVPTIDSTYDAVEVMKPNLDAEAFDELQDLYSSDSFDEKDLKRYIVVNINNDLMVGTMGQYRTTVKVDYYYTCPIKDESTGLIKESPQIPIIGTNTVYDNTGSESEKQLRNVYLYYYPLYGSSLSTCKDFITINNNNNMDVEVYVIKQEPADGSLTQSEMSNKEQTYGVEFNVNESTLNIQNKSHVQLHTNLNENLGYIYTGLDFAINQTRYLRNGSAVTGDMYNTTDIKNKKAHNRIYDVKVEVYLSEKSSNLATFQSSTALTDWFSADNHLITVSSSISQ